MDSCNTFRRWELYEKKYYINYWQNVTGDAKHDVVKIEEYQEVDEPYYPVSVINTLRKGLYKSVKSVSKHLTLTEYKIGAGLRF